MGASGAPYEVLFSGPEGPVADMGREVENAVFLEAFGNTLDVMQAEYTPYDPQSTFIVIRERATGRPASVGRLIVDGPAGMKSLVDLGNEPWNASPEEVLALTGKRISMDELADAATVATLRAHRGVVSLALYQSIYQIMLRSGIRYLVAIQDTKVHRNMSRMLPGSFRPIPDLEQAEYLGVHSVPAWADVSEAEETMKEKAPQLYAMVIGGQGLEDIVGRPDWDAGAALLRP